MLTEQCYCNYKPCPLFGVPSYAGPTNKLCADEITSVSPSTSTTSNSGTTSRSTETSTQSSTSTATPAFTAEPPSKVVGVHAACGVQSASPTLTLEWQALTGGAVTYTVKYSTRPEGALEVRGISGTSTILTALERGTTYYIWVVGVSEGGEGPHSDRMSGVTYDGELITPVTFHCQMHD